MTQSAQEKIHQMAHEKENCISGRYAKILFDYMNDRSLPCPPGFKSLVINEQQIPVSLWKNTLEQCKALCGEDDFGIKVGASIETCHLEPFWTLFSSSGFLIEALINIEKFSHLVSKNNPISIDLDPEFITISIPQVDGWVSQISDEVGLSAIVSLARSISGYQDIVSKVGFVGPYPEHISLYKHYFGCDVTFHGGQPEVSFHRRIIRLLSKENLTWRDTRQPRHEKTSQYLEDSRDIEIRRYRRQLISLIRHGKTKIKDLADENGISVRALQRRLLGISTSFNDLLRETRYRMAMQYLNNKEHSLEKISKMTGFSEQSAFNRAFKEWSGLTPGCWREAHAKKR